jgi:hypothetical protein
MNGHDATAWGDAWLLGNTAVDEPLNVRRETALLSHDPLLPLMTLIGAEPILAFSGFSCLFPLSSRC